MEIQLNSVGFPFSFLSVSFSFLTFHFSSYSRHLSSTACRILLFVLISSLLTPKVRPSKRTRDPDGIASPSPDFYRHKLHIVAAPPSSIKQAPRHHQTNRQPAPGATCLLLSTGLSCVTLTCVYFSVSHSSVHAVSRRRRSKNP